MDFIERILGVAPDHGSGSVEYLLLAALCVLLAYVARRRLRLADDAPRLWS